MPWSPRVQAALVLLATAFTAGCGDVGTIAGGSTGAVALSSASLPRLPQDAHHLYVAQGFYGTSAVYRYALHADGLPSKRPDGVLNLSFPFPGSIAVGPDGDLYVSSAGDASGCKNNQCFVDVFRPGASGKAKPVRVLNVPQGPFYLAVDQHGYLDVSTLETGGNVTNVYGPNAKGDDAPVNQITSSGINALGASDGVVYIQTLATGVEGADELPSGPPPVSYNYRGLSSDGVATDGAFLYAQQFWQVHLKFYLATAVFSLDRPQRPIRTIIGTGCVQSFSGGALGYGLAKYKKYLFEGCVAAGGSAGAVLVYDSTKNGRQAPVMQLPGGDTGVAVGP